MLRSQCRGNVRAGEPPSSLDALSQRAAANRRSLHPLSPSLSFTDTRPLHTRTMAPPTPRRARRHLSNALAVVVCVAAVATAVASAASLPTRGGPTSQVPPELESFLAYRSQAGLAPGSALAARAREPVVPRPQPPPLGSTFSAAGKRRKKGGCMRGAARRRVERGRAGGGSRGRSAAFNAALGSQEDRVFDGVDGRARRWAAELSLAGPSGGG